MDTVDDVSDVATTHGNSWAEPVLAEPEKDLLEFTGKVKLAMAKLMNEFGGPQQFLDHEFMLKARKGVELVRSTEIRNAFAEWLWKTFPESDDQVYHHDTLIPAVPEADFAQQLPTCFHVSAFGYEHGCSIKPPPGKDVFLQLCDRYLLEGFVTSSQPLLVVQPAEIAHNLMLIALPPDQHPGQLKIHSVGFVKGRARVTSMYALLAWFWLNGVDVQASHPLLHASILTLYGNHTPMDSKLDEVISNMTKSAQGAIRRPPNTITMVVMVKELMLHGLQDYSEFIRKWNKKSVAMYQVVGKPATVLKFLFTLDNEFLELILNHIDTMPQGGSAWNDNNLASKKIFPGYQHASGMSRSWSPRIRVSDQSFRMFLVYVQTAHTNSQSS